MKKTNEKTALLHLRLVLCGAMAGIALANVLGLHIGFPLEGSERDAMAGGVGGLATMAVVKLAHVV